MLGQGRESRSGVDSLDDRVRRLHELRIAAEMGSRRRNIAAPLRGQRFGVSSYEQERNDSPAWPPSSDLHPQCCAPPDRMRDWNALASFALDCNLDRGLGRSADRHQ